MSQPNSGLVQSLHARIVNHAKGLRVEPTLLFTRFGLERFLYRLSKSTYADSFVLKGALMMLVWAGESVRATRDADLLGFGEITSEKLERIFRDIAVIPCDPDDGVAFLPDTVAASAIRETDQYGGQRVRAGGRLGTVKLAPSRCWRRRRRVSATGMARVPVPSGRPEADAPHLSGRDVDCGEAPRDGGSGRVEHQNEGLLRCGHARADSGIRRGGDGPCDPGHIRTKKHPHRRNAGGPDESFRP
ncbi:MAG: nucleotidyl transferase AbiEii/AbiGii toxin family protein [Acidobacteria bacterium]|nr:nucleotidyl transferase AbiEii/AbiGii toxin family protein [Acidobacteriota bacterium]